MSQDLVGAPAPMAFTTEAVPGTGTGRVEVPFTLDGVELVAYVPDENQAALFYRVASRTATPADKLNGALEFLEQTLAPAAHDHIRARLLDPADPFGFEPGLSGILTWVAELFADAQEGTSPQNAARQSKVAAATAARRPPRKAAAKKAAKRTTTRSATRK